MGSPFLQIVAPCETLPIPDAATTCITRHGRILCLEDEQDTCELVTIILQAHGYKVTTANTIAEAKRLIADHGFSLYIVDERLPNGEGVDFIREARAAGSKTPILVHSAAAFQRDIDAAMAAGANEYLVKPEGWTKLRQVVDALLRQAFLQ
jgi:DNA-binding response OmpR family regulator